MPKLKAVGAAVKVPGQKGLKVLGYQLFCIFVIAGLNAIMEYITGAGITDYPQLASYAGQIAVLNSVVVFAIKLFKKSSV